MKQIQNIVHEIVAKKLGTMNFSNNDNLRDLGLDSVKAIEIVLIIESTFGFEFESDGLSYETLRNVYSISKYIYEQLKKRLQCKIQE